MRSVTYIPSSIILLSDLLYCFHSCTIIVKKTVDALIASQRIPLHPIAEQILDLYNTTDDTKPVFPLPSRDEMWFEIHELGVAIGRKENLSYHQSRHSFGTFLISEGIPIESIAKMMGHSGIKTTQRYAEVTDKKISKDMDNLMAFRRAYGTGASREKKTKDILTDKEE